MAFSVSICPSLPPFLLQIFSKNHFRLSLLVSCFDYNYASWFWKALSNLENKKTMRFSPQSTRRRVLTKVARHSLLKSRHMPACPATHCYTLNSGWKKSDSAYFSCLQSLSCPFKASTIMVVCSVSTVIPQFCFVFSYIFLSPL